MIEKQPPTTRRNVKNIKHKKGNNMSFMQKGDIIELISGLQDNPKFNSILYLNNNTVNKLLDLAKSKLSTSKDLIRTQLINCKRNCDKSCLRIRLLKKKETEEVCKLKCYLACSNNAINKLLE